MAESETKFKLPQDLPVVYRKKVRYVDYRGLEDHTKFALYDYLNSLWLQGQDIHRAEDRSGFPAITVDCGDIHILTDCLSMESWWHTLPPELKERPKKGDKSSENHN